MDLKVKPIVIITGKGNVDYIHTGNEFYNNNNFSLAIEIYNMAIKSDDVDPTVYFNLGCTHMALGLFGEAVTNFSKYLEHKKHDKEAIEQLEIAKLFLK
jgi:tetratricopeptide (TPR) repeat protein